MPYIGGSVVLVANTTSANQAVGTLEEFITRPSLVRLSAVTSATPANVTLIIGRTALALNQSLVSVGTSVSIKDHVVVEHAALRGRVTLTFVSTATPTVLWRLDVIPMR